MSFEFNSLAWNLITFFSNIPQNIQGVFCIFLALVMGHVIADFSLQGTFMANAKNRHHDHSYGFRTKPPVEPWMYILTAHDRNCTTLGHRFHQKRRLDRF